MVDARGGQQSRHEGREVAYNRLESTELTVL